MGREKRGAASPDGRCPQRMPRETAVGRLARHVPEPHFRRGAARGLDADRGELGAVDHFPRTSRQPRPASARSLYRLWSARRRRQGDLGLGTTEPSILAICRSGTPRTSTAMRRGETKTSRSGAAPSRDAVGKQPRRLAPAPRVSPRAAGSPTRRPWRVIPRQPTSMSRVQSRCPLGAPLDSLVTVALHGPTADARRRVGIRVAATTPQVQVRRSPRARHHAADVDRRSVTLMTPRASSMLKAWLHLST